MSVNQVPSCIKTTKKIRSFNILKDLIFLRFTVGMVLVLISKQYLCVSVPVKMGSWRSDRRESK